MTPFPPPSIAYLTPAVGPSTSRPFLAWPTVKLDCRRIDYPHFPEADEQQARYAMGEFGAWSDVFVDTVTNARERIWLIDPFLLKQTDEGRPNFFSVFEAPLLKTGAKDVRLLTEAKEGFDHQSDALKRIETARQALPRREAFELTIKVGNKKRSPTRMPHDRFAIVDDDLWHWGSNVGGTHHDVNAYSHGWSVVETKADQYFERLWRYAESQRR